MRQLVESGRAAKQSTCWPFLTHEEIKNISLHIYHALWRVCYRAKHDIARPIKRYNYRMRRLSSTPYIVRVKITH